MSDRHGDQPRLGEPTPTLHQPGKRPWYTTRAFVAAVALIAGAALGTAVTLMVDDGGTEEAAVPSETTTTITEPPAPAPRLPQVCIDTLEAAQQGLTLVNQALATLRQGDFAQLDRVLGDLERVRGEFVARVRDCRNGLRP